MSRRFYFDAGSRFALWLLACFAFAALVIQPTTIGRAAGPDNDIAWSEVLHDSRDPLYRNPGGAAPINTNVTLRLRVAANDLTAAQIRLYETKPGAQSFVNMTKVATQGSYDWWAGTVNTGALPSIVYYRFILTDGSDTDYYEDDDRYWGGTGQMYDDSMDRSWALTVYDPAFSTPDWVKNAVFYQVFIDRFNDGDPANNLAAGAYFYGEPTSIERSNATDWNTPLCDPRSGASACPGIYSQNFYGGDLAGLIDKLDYLQDLGVTALYLNPIFESPSNHKYDTSDFSVIDDNFGSLADFTQLVSEADTRGMKIVLDGVFNHASSMGPYFDRYNQYPAITGACEDYASPYAPMFQFFEDTESPTCSDNRDYPYWFGIFSSLAVLDNEGEMARDAVWGDGIVHPSGLDVAVGKYWIEQGAAGWRLDVSPEIDHGMFDLGNDYWENFRAQVHSADPDAYIVGEQWGMAVDWTSGAVEGGVAYPTGNPGEWDATMNYQQSGALLSFWRDSTLNAENDFNTGSSAGVLSPLEPSQFVERYLNIKERYSPEAFAAMMNLLGSHDTQRALWLLDHGHPVTPASGTVYPSSPTHDWSDAIQRLHGVALMQFTLPGAPQIYYGDEIGLVAPSTFDGSTWQDDPYNRIAYPWLDETGTPYYTHLTSSVTQQANFDYYAALANTRNAHAALRTGDIDFLLADDAANRLAYLRQTADGSDSVIVLVNRDGANPNGFTVNLTGKVAVGAQFTDVFTAGAYTVVDNAGVAELTVPSVAANSGMVLTQTNASDMPPAAPTLLTATENDLNIDLSWTGSGADSYNVYRSLVSGAGYTLIGNTASTTFTDTNAVASITYYYVVKGLDANLLESGASNEDSAQTQYNVGGAYRNVQFPSNLTHVISTENATNNVYGQIYIGGVTNALSVPVSGLRAQLGYGPLASDPTVDDDAWTWFEMAPNPGYDFSQNNDEFTGTMQPDAVGAYLFTIRYSGNDGMTWNYATDFQGDDPACPDGGNFAACSLTVNASGDTTAPTAPVLVKDFDTSSEIGISWSGATDNTDIGRYRIYRSVNGGGFAQVAELDDAVSTYVDGSITTASNYDYLVTAVDTSYNESNNSNTISAVAENSMVDVTFVVTVPGFTPADSVVQAIGSVAALTNWGAGVNMTATANPFEYAVTLSVEETSNFNYKYRRDGSWDKGEKAPNGYDEVSDRPFTVGYAEDGPFQITNTVTNWRDVLVTGVTPVDDGCISPAATIAATFNKTVNTSADFDVLDGAMSAVSGVFGVNNGNPPTITFTPNVALAANTTYTVNVSGVSAEGDGQQFHPYSTTFTTQGTLNVTFNVTVPGFTPAGETIYLSGSDAALGSNDPLNGLALTYDSVNGVWTGTAALRECEDVTVFAHRGTAATVETDGATGVTAVTHNVSVQNETAGAMTVNLTVENWKDPLPVAFVPVDAATGVPVTTTISVVYSKDVKPESTFGVTDAADVDVAGTFAYTSGTHTLTFTPAVPLAYNAVYHIAADAAVGADDAAQVSTIETSFTTAPEEITSVELLANGGFEDPATRALAPWLRVNQSGDKAVCNGSIPVHAGICAFRFKNSPNENSTLYQIVDLTGTTFAIGDTLTLSAWVDAPRKVTAFVRLTIKSGDAPKVKLRQTLLMTDGNGFGLVTLPSHTLTTANVTSLKVEFVNKTVKKWLYIDDVSLTLAPGDARQMDRGIIPLPPPDVPSGWRHN